MNEYYLVHYGIPGMKWGVRRYQNADGTLTDAGRKRMLESARKYTEKANAGGVMSTHYRKKANKAAQTVRDSDAAKVKNRKTEVVDREAAKQKAYREGNATEILKYKEELTTQELQAAFTRIQAVQNISNLSAKEIESGKKQLETTVDKVIGWGRKAADLLDTGSRLYSSAEKVRKLLEGDEAPKVTKYKDLNLDKVSDKDLKNIIDRMKNEEKYASLMKSIENPGGSNNKNASNKVVDEILERLEELEKKKQ